MGEFNDFNGCTNKKAATCRSLYRTYIFRGDGGSSNDIANS